MLIEEEVNGWVVIEEIRKESDPEHDYWRCRCSCGAERVVQGSKLRAGRWRSCGCAVVTHGETRKRIASVEVGTVVGMLTVVEPATPGPGGAARWSCLCECGTRTVKRASELKCLHAVNCGCAGRCDRAGMYHLWRGMIARCENPNYPSYHNYGGRGIGVCREWADSFDRFLADVGMRPTPAHSLDRYPDNNGDYRPGNVRWATAAEQAVNKRSNRLITVDGDTRPLCEWADRLGCSPLVIACRIDKLGWPEKKAVTEPVRPWRRASATTA